MNLSVRGVIKERTRTLYFAVGEINPSQRKKLRNKKSDSISKKVLQHTVIIFSLRQLDHSMISDC
jgi:hypothetical protein